MNKYAPIDVFLSRKSEDAPLAKQLYDFLTAKRLKVFDSAYSLPELGNADYQRAIDHALETCTHMIVVGSSVENICSSWVDAEWRLFINEKRAGYKAGNILTVVTPGITIRSLPASLRYYEVIVLEEKNFERIFAYVGRESDPLVEPTIPEGTFKPSNQAIADWYAKGGQCFSEEDYTQAVQWFKKAAEQGYEQAQNGLGVCYYSGQGVKQDFAQAVQWFKKAAEQGFDQAQCHLALCYCSGEGVKQDYVQAVQWYRKAAEQGFDWAQYNLGICYYNGRGVQQNFAEAVPWFEKSAEQGFAWAQYNLGICYENGQGVSKNRDKARYWYVRAAESGHLDAKNRLKNLESSSFWHNLFS